MPNERILVVDDEETIREIVCSMLSGAHFQTRQAANGVEALSILESGEEFDLVLSDLMMAEMDGIALLERAKERYPDMPIVMVTTVHDISVALQAIRNGAYDYLPKPFELPIFLARLQGLLRRSAWLKGSSSDIEEKKNGESAPVSQPDQDKIFTFNGKTIDFDTLELRTGGNTIQLTLMEAKLLRHLIQSHGRTVSRKSILEDVWGLREDTDTRAIDNFIVRLRRYIEEDPTKPRHLLTVRGLGYRFVI